MALKDETPKNGTPKEERKPVEVRCANCGKLFAFDVPGNVINVYDYLEARIGEHEARCDGKSLPDRSAASLPKFHL